MDDALAPVGTAALRRASRMTACRARRRGMGWGRYTLLFGTPPSLPPTAIVCGQPPGIGMDLGVSAMHADRRARVRLSGRGVPGKVVRDFRTQYILVAERCPSG